jgi:hypothetical protein
MITNEHLQVFRGYDEDDVALIAGAADAAARGAPGFVTDFAGLRYRTEHLWKAARELDGQVTQVAIPADFHAEAIEWLGLVKSVNAASDQYVAMELGAGYAPWLVAGGVLARRRGIVSVRLYGVEGDPQHCEMMRQHFLDNGLDPAEHRLLEGAAAASDGTLYWPESPDDSRDDWGNRPEPAGSQTTYRGHSGMPLRPVRPIRSPASCGRSPCGTSCTST